MYASVVLIPLVLAGCGRSPTSAAAAATAQSAVTIETARADVMRFLPVVVGNGTIAAEQELIVAAEVGGLRIVDVLADEGSVVKRGQVLARLNNTILQAQLRQNEAQVRDAEAALTSAQTELRRAQALGQTITETTLAQRQTAAQSAETRVALVKAQAEELQARLAQAEVRAPADGVISRRTALLGSVASAGGELFRLIRDGQLELNAQVPELDLDRLAAQQSVRVVHGDMTVAAVVRAIAPTVDPTTRLGTVRVTLPLGTGLRPGMFARAEIAVGATSGIAVPRDAIVFSDGRPGVFAVGPDNRVSFARVTTGLEQDGWVEVRSGVAAGTNVAVTGAAFLSDGDMVRVNPPRPLTGAE